MMDRSFRHFVVLVAAALLAGPACAQQDGGSATSALTEGRYEDAIRIGNAAVRADPTDRRAREALARALFEVGRYDEVIEAATELPLLRGDALRETGRLDEALTAFREAAEEGGPNQLTAELKIAEILYMRGERDEANTRFDRFIDVYNRSDRLPAEDLVAIGNAVTYLGLREPVLFQDAVMAFDEATQVDPSYIEAHIRLGELFVEKYDGAQAGDALRDALALNPNHPRALLALARAHAFDGRTGQAMETVRQSLEINPNLVPARLFLARMHIDAEDYEQAEEQLDRALEVNPASLEALSMVAALRYVRGDVRGYEEIRQQVRRLNPRDAGLLTTVAEIAAQVRRYGDAAELAAEAVTLDAGSWEAFGVLGLNQFRLGRIDEARQSLETAFAGDPYNVWIKNNLDLLDTFEEYEIRTVGDIELMLHGSEADLLFPYVSLAAREAHADLTRRYGDEVRGRIRVELYPRSADFSVRTVGLAGLGALGVSFGDLVALDSPSARQPGSYNWLMTLWHELAHTAALGVSENRVPRWLTEGMSVVEERRTNPAWVPHILPEFLIAYDDGELPPVSTLNEGFIRPPTPQHLGLAYQMASHVAEWIEETRGFDTLVRMLRGYADGGSTDEIIRSVLGAEPRAIDQEFDRWLRARATPDQAREFMRHLEVGQQELSAGDLDAAQRSLEAAAALFPMSRRGSPYGLLARIHTQRGDEAAAMAALERHTDYDFNDYGANLELARMKEDRGDLTGAAAALDRAVWIYPFEVEPHLRLARIASELGQHDLAVRERMAIIGLRPTDMAEARYQLAAALLGAGRPDEARAEVLRALEIAPAYQEAQELLLRIHEGT